jgi:hypothetical protein
MKKKIINWFSSYLALLIVLGVGLLCFAFIIFGTTSKSGYITLNGEDAKIEDYTENLLKTPTMLFIVL